MTTITVSGVPEESDWFESALRDQLAMNPQMLELLREDGVGPDSRVRLNFSYAAPGESEAEELVAFFEAETCYEVASASPDGLWMVEGTTRPMHVSSEILDRWLAWMVAAGAEHGRCLFGGWGWGWWSSESA